MKNRMYFSMTGKLQLVGHCSHSTNHLIGTIKSCSQLSKRSRSQGFEFVRLYLQINPIPFLKFYLPPMLVSLFLHLILCFQQIVS
ncbi:hypothetical protein Lalb_Chr16g0387831 [Lupinus albus]|uniref:Uncharacterized protein n=1 Tax=Lupinus albus TaxID=3870 RepID=A0A6A4P6W2_LUPAL|nr:hypothetical protein Lalb_Chr16g0387831 [Lupinus albus]